MAAAAVLDMPAKGGREVSSRGEDNAKRRQILDGARRVFLADGFDGASMNEVARSAGVSKGTLYVYFTDKQDLFAALIRDEKQSQAEQLCRFDTDDVDVRATLSALGVRLMELMTRPESIAQLRTVVAVAAKFPAIGRAYYEAGPLFGRRRLAAYFDRQVAAGRLAADDTELAATQFIDLCKGRYHLEAMMGVAVAPTEAELRAHIGRTVESFLRLYGPAGH